MCVLHHSPAGAGHHQYLLLESGASLRGWTAFATIGGRMSSPVFVRDAQGTPLMPTSAAYARRLIEGGKARWVPHHAFSVLQLTQAVAQPTLRPVVVGVIVHLHTAELLLLADGE